MLYQEQGKITKLGFKFTHNCPVLTLCISTFFLKKDAKKSQLISLFERHRWLVVVGFFLGEK